MNPITTDSFTRVILLMILGFQGISLGMTNLNLFDTRNVVHQVEESAMNTERIVESGESRSLILQELRQTQRIIDETRQNQTDELIPPLVKQFNQTDTIFNKTHAIFERLNRGIEVREVQEDEILSLLRNISEAVNNLPKGDTNFN